MSQSDESLNQFLTFTRERLKIELTPKELDSPIDTFDLDSLDFIEFLMGLENEFGTQLDMDMLPSNVSLGDIYRLIRSSQTAQT